MMDLGVIRKGIMSIHAKYEVSIFYVSIVIAKDNVDNRQLGQKIFRMEPKWSFYIWFSYL